MKKLISLMSACCCLYSVKLFVSPVYIIFILLIFLSGGRLALSRKKFSIPPDAAVIIIFLIYATVISALSSNSGATYVNLATGGAAYVILRIVSRNYGSDFWEGQLKLASYVFAIIASIDTIYRLLNPQHPSTEFMERMLENPEEAGYFYLYKFGSLMFADSNTTGIIAAIFLFILLELRRSGRKVPLALVGLYCILIVLTFSRAAYVAVMLTLPLVWIRPKLYLLVLLPGVFAAAVLSNQNMLFTDGSLISKLYILDVVSAYYIKSSGFHSEFFFGVGLGESLSQLGIYTHLLMLTLLFEAGLVGLVVYGAFLICVLYRYRMVRRPLLAIGILSLSYFLYLGGPFIFVPIALLINFEMSFRREKKAVRFLPERSLNSSAIT